MKKTLILATMGAALTLSCISANAVEYAGRADRSYGFLHWGYDIGAEVNHLNRMVGHVRWQLTRYHPDSRVRADFADIRRDVDRVNETYRAQQFNRRDLHDEIGRLHTRLHDLEVRMKVRSNDYYNWR